MNKTFLKGLFFGMLIVTSVSLFGDTMYKKIVDTVETHEAHKEQKIVYNSSTEFNRDNNWTATVPYGWHVIAITDVGAGGSCLVVMEKN